MSQKLETPTLDDLAILLGRPFDPTTDMVIYGSSADIATNFYPNIGERLETDPDRFVLMDLSGLIFHPEAYLAGRNLTGVRMKGAIAENVDFTGANLTRAKLDLLRAKGANWKEVIFDSAQLPRADLRGARGLTRSGKGCITNASVYLYYIYPEDLMKAGFEFRDLRALNAEKRVYFLDSRKIPFEEAIDPSRDYGRFTAETLKEYCEYIERRKKEMDRKVFDDGIDLPPWHREVNPPLPSDPSFQKSRGPTKA